MTSDRPIFVVGCPRSGTTMLSLMIHAHPRLAMPPESRFLIKTWRRRAKFGDLSTPEQRRALAEIVRPHRLQGPRPRPGPAGDAEPILDGPPTIGSAFGIVFHEFAEPHGKARWGDKRPAYYQEVDVLLRLFPDAQIVHIVRDGRANVASLKTHALVAVRQHRLDGDLVAGRVLHAAQRSAAAGRHVPRHALRVAGGRPRAELRQLCAFLDEEFDRRDARAAPRCASVVPERKTWHKNLNNTVNTDRVESWRKGLDPWELGLMETVLRRKLRRYGYPISGAGQAARPEAGRDLRQGRVRASVGDAQAVGGGEPRGRRPRPTRWRRS